MGRQEKLLSTWPCSPQTAQLTAIAALMANPPRSINPNSKTVTKKPAATFTPVATTVSASTKNGTEPGFDHPYSMAWIHDPADYCHTLHKKETSEQLHPDEQADVNPQTINAIFTSERGIRSVNGMHSGARSWNGTWFGLMRTAGMPSPRAFASDDFTMMREADSSPVNGDEATYDSTDMDRLDATERQIPGSNVGAGEFERDDVWDTARGYAIQLVRDDQILCVDDSLFEMVHYKEAIDKK